MNGRIVVATKHIFLILFFALVFLGLASTFVSPLAYIDECVAIIAFPLLGKKLAENKIGKKGKRILLFLVFIMIIGMISTLIARISPNLFTSVLDMFLFLKPFFIFLLFYSLPQHYKDYIMKKFFPFAKLLLLIICILGCVSQVIDIGMTIGREKLLFFDINVFGFILRNGIQTIYLTATCFMCICYCEKSQKKFMIYALVYFLILVFVIGGFSSVLLLCSALFLYIFRNNKKKKINIRQMVLVAFGGFVLAYSDIKSYLVNSYAPRALLLKYGFITASNFFPFGAGFASYGSEMARRYYSPLYYKYGFNEIWSLSYENNKLNSTVGTIKDVYVGMIAGQYGWIGLIIFIGIMLTAFSLINNRNAPSHIKAISLASFITIAVTMMVSANSTTLMGTVLFAALGLTNRENFFALNIQDTGQPNSAIERLQT